MQNLMSLNLLSLAALVCACSGTAERENPNLARKSESAAMPYTQDWEAGGGDWSSVRAVQS
jgi:hypothetical protein